MGMTLAAEKPRETQKDFVFCAFLPAMKTEKPKTN